jgi:hypothetical protein
MTAVAGYIQSLVSPYTKIEFASYRGGFPEAEKQDNEFQHSGVDGQGYQDGGEHGVSGLIEVGIDSVSAAAREITYLALLSIRGHNVTLKLGPDTKTGYKFRNVKGTPADTTMALAGGGVVDGKFFKDITLEIQKVIF